MATLRNSVGGGSVGHAQFQPPPTPVVDPTPLRLVANPQPTGLLWAHTFEEGTAGANVSAASSGGLVLSVGAPAPTYSAAAAIHGALAASVTSASYLVYPTPRSKQFQFSVYMRMTGWGTGGNVGMIALRTFGTSAGAAMVRYEGSATGTPGRINLCTGANSVVSSSTARFVPGDVARMDFSVDYSSNTSVTLTLRLFLNGNIEGTVPDDTVTATFALAAAIDSIWFQPSSGFTYDVDTVRAYGDTNDLADRFGMPSATPGLSGSGTLSAAASSPAVAAAGGFSGDGSLTATAVPAIAAPGGLSGAGALSAAAFPAIAAPGALAGSGSLTAAAAPAIPAPAALSGAGSLTASTAQTASSGAALSGSGTLAAVVKPALAAAGALSGSGSLTAAAAPATASPAALSGSGTLSAAAKPAFAAPAALSGSGTLGAVAVPATSSPAALSGAGTLSATSRPAVSGSAALSGIGTLSGATSGSGSASPALSGSGTLTSAVKPALTTTAALSGTGALTTAVKPALTTTAALNGVGTLTVIGKPSFAGAAALSGTGTLNAGAVPKQSGVAALSGDGTLATVQVLAIATPRSLSGDGTLTASRPPSVLRAVLAARAPDDDPGAVAGARRQATGWVNRRRVRHATTIWVGPVAVRPTGVILRLATTPGSTAPAESDWQTPVYVDSQPGVLFTEDTRGPYSVWARDSSGTPTRFATITVT